MQENNWETAYKIFDWFVGGYTTVQPKGMVKSQ